jgi:hypothetical protein
VSPDDSSLIFGNKNKVIGLRSPQLRRINTPPSPTC